MSRLGARMARLENALRPKHANTGTVEYHYPECGVADSSGRALPCDKRDEHGPDCVMTVSPTKSGFRLMRIVYGWGPE
jgi:hypothetical protein